VTWMGSNQENHIHSGESCLIGSPFLPQLFCICPNSVTASSGDISGEESPSECCVGEAYFVIFTDSLQQSLAGI
jgi:hypothetical protein